MSRSWNRHAGRRAAERVLDAFYLEGRVMSEAEYAPCREAMRGGAQGALPRRMRQLPRLCLAASLGLGAAHRPTAACAPLEPSGLLVARRSNLEAIARLLVAPAAGGDAAPPRSGADGRRVTDLEA